MANIDFFCLIGGNSPPYSDFLHRTGDVLKSGQHNIHWKAIEVFYTGSDKRREIQLNQLPRSKNYTYVDTFHDDPKVDGSPNHANALHRIFKHAKSEYVVIADADIAITYKDWDDWTINTLNKGFACAGFQYRYYSFPCQQYFAFRRDLLDTVKIDFMPKMSTSKNAPASVNLKKRDARILGLKVGDKIKCDTGWKLPFILADHGMKCFTMNRVFGNEPNHQLPFENKRQKKYCLKDKSYRTMSEFHADGKMFGTHMLASRIYDYNGKFASTWRSRVTQYFQEQHGIML